MKDKQETNMLLKWIGDKCFYSVKDKRTKTNLAMQWVKENAHAYDWKWEHIKKAIKHQACTSISEFKRLCNYFRDNS